MIFKLQLHQKKQGSRSIISIQGWGDTHKFDNCEARIGCSTTRSCPIIPLFIEVKTTPNMYHLISRDDNSNLSM